MANAKKTAAPKNVDVIIGKLIEDHKSAIQRHLAAIVDHMNALDKHGLEVQFNVAKVFSAPDKEPEYSVQNLFVLRRY